MISIRSDFGINSMAGGQKKRALSGAERQSKYVKENKEQVALTEAKRQFERTKLLQSDSDKADAMREAARVRKRIQREKQKNAIVEGEQTTDENETRGTKRRDRSIEIQTTSLSVLGVQNTNSAGPSRQRIEGDKQKKKYDKEKIKTIKELIEETEAFKTTQDKHDDELVEMDFKLSETVKELNRYKDKVMQLIEERGKAETENDDWVGKVYKNMTSAGRKDFRNAFTVASYSLKRGTILRLRRTTGLNFSNTTTNSIEEESELKKKIIEFAKDNTIDVPDKKKYLKGARFRTASLLSLYSTFESHNPGLCTYPTFTRYWPALFVKPLASEFGTCLCTTCQNMELKVESLLCRKVIFKDEDVFTLDSVIKATREENYDLENKFKSEIEILAEEDKANIDIGFLEWTKVKQVEISMNTGKTKGDKTMRLSKHLPAAELGKIILEEFEKYKNHLDRDFVMKQELKKVRCDAQEEEDVAVLHIDWAEQHKITEVKEIQSAYFNGRYSYDIHTGYVYTKEDSHGFASISDSSDHKAEAIHNAIKPKVEELVAKGKTKFVICSDSPSSQYRNSKNVFLMRRLCLELNITIRLLFTEAGHGKSPCDGVGGNIKTQVEDVLLNIHGNHELEPIHSAEDVAKVIAEKTNLTYDIKVHKQETTYEIRDSLPKLSALVGAMTTHEVMITSDGVMKKKNLPTDAFYKPVTIRESRKSIRNEIRNDIRNEMQAAEENIMAIQATEETSNEIQVPEETSNENEQGIASNNNLDEAFMEDDSYRDTTRKRIMTNAEIAAELDASSDDSEIE